MVKFHNIGPRQHFVPQNLTSCKKVQKGKIKKCTYFPPFRKGNFSAWSAAQRALGIARIDTDLSV